MFEESYYRGSFQACINEKGAKATYLEELDGPTQETYMEVFYMEASKHFF